MSCSQDSCSPNTACNQQQACATSGSCSPSKGDCAESYLCCLVDSVECAKKCLMKDKIKERLEARLGKKMDSLADLAVDMYIDKMEKKINCMGKKHEAAERLKGIMMED